MINNILVLTDFSLPSKHAMKAGKLLAQKYNSSLYVLHNKDNEISQSDKSNVEDFLIGCRALNLDTRFIISEGELKEEVGEYIVKLDVDLIIMGSSGKSKKDSNSWGSNTKRITKSSKVPVLVIKSKLVSPHFKNILYASSFTAQEKPIYNQFLELIELDNNSTLHLMSVNTDSFFTQPLILVNEAMEDFVNMSPNVNTKTHFYNDYGVKAGIIHFTEEFNVDLIVMSDNENKIKHFLWGHDARKVAQEASCPVLIMDRK